MALNWTIYKWRHDGCVFISVSTHTHRVWSGPWRGGPAGSGSWQEWGSEGRGAWWHTPVWAGWGVWRSGWCWPLTWPNLAGLQVKKRVNITFQTTRSWLYDPVWCISKISCQTGATLQLWTVLRYLSSEWSGRTNTMICNANRALI